MKASKWIVTGTILCISSTLYAGESNGVILSYYEPLQRLSIATNDPTAVQKSSGAGPVSLSFDALSRSFDLQLESNAALFPAESRNALPEGVEIYRGGLAGEAESWARIVMYEGMPRGLVWDGEQLFAIEAPGDSLVQTSSPIIYRLADATIQPGTMTCGAESLPGNGSALYQKLVAELGTAFAKGPGAVSEIDISTIGDFEFTDKFANEAAAIIGITSRLNNVDGIYSQDIGVQINVPLVETHSDAADPFTDESDASMLLDELADYRNNTAAHNSRGLTHLYTGRNLDGNTVGIAFSGSGVLCNSFAGAGLSEGNSSVTFDALVAAHEIGHNFGAPHDSDMGGACGAEPQDFIMAPFVSLNNNQFSPCSIAIMQANAAAASCINPLPTVDMAVALNGQLSNVLLGNSATVTFDVSNNGTLQAANVVAGITLPNNVSFVSAAASVGTCTNGAGAVDCVLGTVSGTSLNTVTVSTITTDVGVGTFDASVTTTDVDERPSNNQQSVQLTVDAAVDLVVDAPAITTTNLNQSTTINATLENLSNLDATGVTLGISFNSGLQADSANWSIGNCTVAAQQVDCTANNFANQSNSTLSFGVTGTSVGSVGYSIALSANELDADPTNNNVNGLVTVSDPNASSGGAIGLPFLYLLGWAVFLMRRRSFGI